MISVAQQIKFLRFLENNQLHVMQRAVDQQMEPTTPMDGYDAADRDDFYSVIKFAKEHAQVDADKVWGQFPAVQSEIV